MKLGIIGLGKMGIAIAQRAIDAGHEVIGFDLNKDLVHALQAVGGHGSDNVAYLAQTVSIVWLMLPAGKVIDNVMRELFIHMKSGDILIDGGNSKFTDSIVRAERARSQGIFFLDCGTSGGVHAKDRGFCLMVGGEYEAYMRVYNVFEAIAAPGGVAHMGPSGTGHYVKMVHNGIEYALMQAYAEGIHVIKEGSFKDQKINLEEVTRVWNNGSIIRSWIIELLHGILSNDQDLKGVSGKIQSTGMGLWTVEEADCQNISVEVIKAALQIRELSLQNGGDYGTKLVSLLRNAFGGHSVEKL
jgi:6-phosphogluconate dehydrogenase